MDEPELSIEDMFPISCIVLLTFPIIILVVLVPILIVESILSIEDILFNELVLSYDNALNPFIDCSISHRSIYFFGIQLYKCSIWNTSIYTITIY
jgi:hypothetical protein